MSSAFRSVRVRKRSTDGLTAIITCDGAKNLAETFSIQLAKGFNPLLNRLRASTGYLYDVSKSCGSLIQCQQNGLRFPSTDHGINLPMPKFFPLINYCCGCPLRCCLRPTFSVRSIFRAFNNPRSMKQPFSLARPQIVSGTRCFVSICFTAKDTNFLAFTSFMGQ